MAMSARTPWSVRDRLALFESFAVGETDRRGPIAPTNRRRTISPRLARLDTKHSVARLDTKHSVLPRAIPLSVDNHGQQSPRSLTAFFQEKLREIRSKCDSEIRDIALRRRVELQHLREVHDSEMRQAMEQLGRTERLAADLQLEIERLRSAGKQLTADRNEAYSRLSALSEFVEDPLLMSPPSLAATPRPEPPPPAFMADNNADELELKRARELASREQRRRRDAETRLRDAEVLSSELRKRLERQSAEAAEAARAAAAAADLRGARRIAELEASLDNIRTALGEETKQRGRAERTVGVCKDRIEVLEGELAHAKLQGNAKTNETVAKYVERMAQVKAEAGRERRESRSSLMMVQSRLQGVIDGRRRIENVIRAAGELSRQIDEFIKPDVTCRDCLGSIAKACVLHPCGHTYCWDCLSQRKSAAGYYCIVCDRTFRPKASFVSPNLSLDSIIQRYQVWQAPLEKVRNTLASELGQHFRPRAQEGIATPTRYTSAEAQNEAQTEVSTSSSDEEEEVEIVESAVSNEATTHAQ